MTIAGEAERIRIEYARRAAEIPTGFYDLEKPANLFLNQQRLRDALKLLRRARLLPLAGRRVLEVGCGTGGWLPDLEALGVQRADLAGIDLDGSRVERARARLCGQCDASGNSLTEGADLRTGDAAALPWPDARFDVVIASTVFSSILDADMRRAVAGEMLRVLTPRGVVLWYDFFVDNPWNPHVKGVRRREIEALFNGCELTMSRVTLAPPVARRIVPVSWLAAAVLEAMKFLNTHYVALVRRR